MPAPARRIVSRSRCHSCVISSTVNFELRGLRSGRILRPNEVGLKSIHILASRCDSYAAAVRR